jgi:hypothetical protein
LRKSVSGGIHRSLLHRGKSVQKTLSCETGQTNADRWPNPGGLDPGAESNVFLTSGFPCFLQIGVPEESSLYKHCATAGVGGLTFRAPFKRNQFAKLQCCSLPKGRPNGSFRHCKRASLASVARPQPRVVADRRARLRPDRRVGQSLRPVRKWPPAAGAHSLPQAPASAAPTGPGGQQKSLQLLGGSLF